MSENTKRGLYMLCNVYAWSNNPKKAPRLGHKWAAGIPQKRKKYLWYVTVAVWTDGVVGFMDPVLATETEIEKMNRERTR